MGVVTNNAGVVDTSRAIQIADRIWWVGHYLPDDVFQCHAYLIENGDQSVLIDPGSELTFRHTLRKIKEVTSFDNIRYFVCHHQDPDITAAMRDIDTMVTRDDALLVTHWRAAALLKHYGLKMPFWQVEEHEWRLELSDRTLEFIFTPYMHFPGAFCTFDRASGILFSSDIFGGFTEEWSLFARDESYFENIRPFHEHYMPSQEILLHGMLTLEQYPIKAIAPQHGSIIAGALVPFMINKLKTLQCGLYLMTRSDSDISRLMRLNRFVREATETMISYREFRQVAEHFYLAARDVLPVSSLEFFIVEPDGTVLHFTPQNRYHGEESVVPRCLQPIMNHDGDMGVIRSNSHFDKVLCDEEGSVGLAIPLPVTEESGLRAVAMFRLEEDVPVSDEMNEVLGRLNAPLAVAVEREDMYRGLERDRNRIYERSIRDPLTGLFSRHYMNDTVGRMIGVHERDTERCLALIMFDIDHFKHINDTFGHQTGDEVLRQVGHTILQNSRDVDVPVRFGGEEFSLFVLASKIEEAMVVAERIRGKIESMQFYAGEMEFNATISAGVALHEQGEKLAEMMKRADAALYEAKNSGRNRVCIAREAEATEA
jgi:diguanylate cyclase (GGDEF)-like protein